MATHESFAAEAELARRKAFEEKNRATECRRCKKKGQTLTKLGRCYDCESIRLKSMQDMRFKQAVREPIPANESAQECNARIARAHADLKARERFFDHPQTDAEKLIGVNGPLAVGVEFARCQAAENLRMLLEESLKSLAGFANRSSDSPRARAAYEDCHARCVVLATKYHAYTGRTVTIAGLLPDFAKAAPIVIGAPKVVDPFADDDEPAPKPSKIKVDKFAKGYGRT